MRGNMEVLDMLRPVAWSYISDIIETPHHKPINIILNLQILEPIEKIRSSWILAGAIDISEQDMFSWMFWVEINRDREFIFVNGEALKHLLIPYNQ